MKDVNVFHFGSGHEEVAREGPSQGEGYGDEEAEAEEVAGDEVAVWFLRRESCARRRREGERESRREERER